MKNARWFLVSILVLVVAACAGGGGGGSSDDDDDAASTSTPTPTPAGTPTFATDIIPIFDQTCGTLNNACHSRVAYAANSTEDCRGWLSLENASLGSEYYDGPNVGNPTGCLDRTLYERLTMAALADAWQCGPPANGGAKVPYVVPGDADASYLFRKINGGPYCGTPSDPMPQTGSLDAQTIDVIRRWIDGGALP